MLPVCRTAGEGFAIPTFDLTPGDVDGFMEELWAFQSAFHDCFARSEPRAHFFDYMVGQFSKLERKSIEPIALQVEGGTIRGLQRFISDVVWDEDQMRWNYHQLVAEEMGDPDGVLMFDETGFVKKGTDSVGVARQYCGTLGKVENCQVGVFAGYASRQGSALHVMLFFENLRRALFIFNGLRSRYCQRALLVRSSVAERYSSCRQYRYNVVAHIPLEQPDETLDPV